MHGHVVISSPAFVLPPQHHHFPSQHHKRPTPVARPTRLQAARNAISMCTDLRTLQWGAQEMSIFGELRTFTEPLSTTGAPERRERGWGRPLHGSQAQGLRAAAVGHTAQIAQKQFWIT